MKKLVLVFSLILSMYSFSQAQSWSTGTGKMYINPTSTKVGIGTTSPEYYFHLYNTLRPDFYISNPKGGLRLSVAYNGWDYAPGSQPGDAVFNINSVDW